MRKKGFFVKITHACLFCIALFQTVLPAAVSDDIRALLPAGKECRIVWTFGSQADLDISSGNSKHLKVLDTKTGIIRQLTYDSLFPGTVINSLEMPTITKDGRRVIFYNSVNGNVYSINWDGSGLREIASAMKTGDSWQNPEDGSQWIIVTQTVKNENTSMFRLNIDTYEKLPLWDRTIVGMGTNAMGSLSPDGKYLTANFPWPNKAIVAVPNGLNGTDYTALPNGCYPSMTEDGACDVLHIVNHTLFTISDKAGATIYNKSTRQLFNAGPANGSAWEYTFLRWSNDRDIMSFYIQQKTWPEMRGATIASFSKGAFVRVDSTGARIHVHVYDGLKNLAGKPRICAPDTIKISADSAVTIPLDVCSESEATLVGEGLPGTLTIGRKQGNAFCITGAIRDSGAYRLQFNASNSDASVSRTVVLVVSAENQLAMVRNNSNIEKKIAQNDNILLISSDCEYDYSFPPPAYQWTLLSGQKGVTIGSPKTAATLVLIPSLLPDEYKFRLDVSAGRTTVTDTVRIKTLSTLPFKVLFPAGGDTLFIGDTCPVAWQLDPPERVTVDLSTDGGMTYNTINEDGSVNGSDIITRWKWVPQSVAPSDQCLLKISSYTNPGKYARTNAVFVISTRTENTKETQRREYVFAPKIICRRNSLLTVQSSANVQVYSLNGTKLPVVSRLDGLTTVCAPRGIFLVVTEHATMKVSTVSH
jgi:hypothetical protein